MSFLSILLIIVVVLIVGSILLQPGESGFLGGGTSLMGGGENYHTRRGLEKVLFYTTFIWIALFVVISVLLIRSF